MSKTSDIKIRVHLGENQVPEKMEWSADGQGQANQEAKAMLLSLFDPKTKDTLRIDLWTGDMQVVEMDRLVFHTLKGIADSYFRATNNQKLASAMQQFVQFFGEETEILRKET